MSAPEQTISVARPLSIGLAALIVLIVAIGGWSIFTAISGAVIAKGEVRVQGHTRVISHEVGGIVAEALVQNGDPVNAGDILVMLEDSVLQARLEGVRSRLFELLTAEARWRAQAIEEEKLVIGQRLGDLRLEYPEIEKRLQRQQSQLDLGRRSLGSNVTQKGRIIAQIEQQIEGKKVRLDSLHKEANIIMEEIERVQDLLRRGLDKRSNLSRIERDHAMKTGEIGMTKAEIAEKEERIVELEMAMRTLGEDFRERALQKVSETEAEKAKLMVEHAELLMKLKSLSIVAPVDGVIHDSRLYGSGSMVVAGVPVVSIVPDADAVVVRVKINSRDIDQVHVGQSASIRLESFNVRSTPLIEGKVIRIGADTTFDPILKKRFYEIEIELMLDGRADIRQVDLVNGMPVSAFLKTAPQSPVEYVIRPIAAFFSTSFRDT